MINEEELKRHQKDVKFNHNRHFLNIKKVVTDYEKDEKIEYRRKHQECKYCTYVDSKIGGSAISVSQCCICGKDIFNGSTNVDYCCNECAKKYNICKHCGNNMDWKTVLYVLISIKTNKGEI